MTRIERSHVDLFGITRDCRLAPATDMTMRGGVDGSSRQSSSRTPGTRMIAPLEVGRTRTSFGLAQADLLGIYLLANAGRVLSKAQILDRVWNYDFGGEAHIVELYISYLRKKIDFGRVPLIHTVRGVGYVLKPAG